MRTDDLKCLSDDVPAGGAFIWFRRPHQPRPLVVTESGNDRLQFPGEVVIHFLHSRLIPAPTRFYVRQDATLANFLQNGT